MVHPINFILLSGMIAAPIQLKTGLPFLPWFLVWASLCFAYRACWLVKNVK